MLAEDNYINQRVAIALLQKVGISVDVASNGLEAIEAIKSKDYSLILMDVQMPQMDGLVATDEIRNTLKNNDVVIVAMTANAMKGDREKCLASGMNDYVSKPIIPNDLYQMLEKWLINKGK